MNGIMIQGTGSDAGKSFLTTGLCRIFSDRGFRVCPFKSQNMSNNSYVTVDGLEMGRAQAVQAEAARISPEVFMNPVLLKPRGDVCSEIILMGKVFDAPADRNYYRVFTMEEGLAAMRAALARIRENFDRILIEGAGSPAEINLNAAEIVNMRVAREADVPVILAADVDRGGSLASVVGTLELLGSDRDRVKGIIFNKFRGDLALFKDAVSWTERRTGIRVVGVVPWLPGLRIAGEDSLSMNWRRPSARPGRETERLLIGVVQLPYISNHTDLEAFAFEGDVDLTELDADFPLTRLGLLDAVIIPGTKNTLRDMDTLHRSGLARAITDFHADGGAVFGICGGLQMMGRHLDDRWLKENDTFREMEGLGLLPLETVFEAKKTVARRAGRLIHPAGSGAETPVEGYEIHFGATRRLPEGTGDFYPLFSLDGHEDGLGDSTLRTAGTYLHGVFHNDAFRALWLNSLRAARGFPRRPVTDTAGAKEKACDDLAAHLSRHLDVEYLIELSGS